MLIVLVALALVAAVGIWLTERVDRPLRRAEREERARIAAARIAEAQAALAAASQAELAKASATHKLAA